MLNFLNSLDFERLTPRGRPVEPDAKLSKQSYQRYEMLNFLNTLTIAGSNTNC